MDNTRDYRARFFETFAEMFRISQREVEEFAERIRNVNPIDFVSEQRKRQRRKRQSESEKRKKHQGV